MPANLLIAAGTRAHCGLRWGIPSMLLAIPYLLAAYWCVSTIEARQPRLAQPIGRAVRVELDRADPRRTDHVILLIRARVREAIATRRRSN